jgi:hypothetical protein
MKFNNGDKVKDNVTSLTGIIVATMVCLNGCIRYCIQPQELKDGKPVDGTYFDENDLILVKAETVKPVQPRITGGPQRQERRAPRR